MTPDQGPGQNRASSGATTGLRALFWALVALSVPLLVYLAFRNADPPPAGSQDLWDRIRRVPAVLGSLESPFPLLAVLVALLVLRRAQLFRLAWWNGRVEVRLLEDASAEDLNVRGLTAAFREYISLPKVYETTVIPGDPSPDHLLELFQPQIRGRWLEVASRALAYAFPARAYIVSGTLRTQNARERCGVTIQVRKLPGSSFTELETQWSSDWDRALKRAAYSVAAHVLPQTAACRKAPWSRWRGQVIPPGLVRDYQRAKMMTSERRYDEALALYRSALRRDAGNVDIRYDLGQVHERFQRYADALDIYLELTDRLFPPHGSGVGVFRRTGAIQLALFPTVERDPFAMRYRYVTVLGFAEKLAEQLIDVDLDRPQSPASDERRPWRQSELRSLREQLATRLHQHYGPILVGRNEVDPRELLEERSEIRSPQAIEQRRQVLAGYLLEVARREHHLLRRDLRIHRWLGRLRRRGRSQVTPAAQDLAAYFVDLRIRQLTGDAGNWPPTVEDLITELAEHGYDERSSNWQEHYVAACVLAFPVHHDQEEKAEHRAWAQLAVAALERALRCEEDGQLITAKSYWLFAGDPDLVGLRRYAAFRALESKVYGLPSPAAEDYFAYEMLEYVREMLRIASQALEDLWRERARRVGRAKRVSAAAVEEWWRAEGVAIRLAIRTGRFYQQPQTRHALIRTLHHWTSDRGAPRPRIIFPNLAGTRRAAHVSVTTARIHQIQAFLGFLADEVGLLEAPPPVGSLQRNTLLWRAYAAGDVRSGRLVSGLGADQLRRMCEDRAGMWAGFRQWADGGSAIRPEELRVRIAALALPPEPEPPVVDVRGDGVPVVPDED